MIVGNGKEKEIIWARGGSNPVARNVCAMLVPGTLSVGGMTQGSSIKSASLNLRLRTHLALGTGHHHELIAPHELRYDRISR